VDCGGISICEHRKRRSTCKDCGGASICEHNRRRSECKDSWGASICEHNRKRSRCKDCGGASICEHNRERSECKDCGGTSICEHNQERAKFKDCRGTSRSGGLKLMVRAHTLTADPSYEQYLEEHESNRVQQGDRIMVPLKEIGGQYRQSWMDACIEKADHWVMIAM